MRNNFQFTREEAKKLCRTGTDDLVARGQPTEAEITAKLVELNAMTNAEKRRMRDIAQPAIADNLREELEELEEKVNHISGSDAGVFVARRTRPVAITANTPVNLSWSGQNVTQDTSTIDDFQIVNSSCFQNTANKTRFFLCQLQASFQGATQNINEASSWWQVGDSQNDIVTASSLRWGLTVQKNLETVGATLASNTLLVVPANDYFGMWLFCDRNANINGDASSTTIYGLAPTWQNRLVIREV